MDFRCVPLLCFIEEYLVDLAWAVGMHSWGDSGMWIYTPLQLSITLQDDVLALTRLPNSMITYYWSNTVGQAVTITKIKNVRIGKMVSQHSSFIVGDLSVSMPGRVSLEKKLRDVVQPMTMQCLCLCVSVFSGQFQLPNSHLPGQSLGASHQ